MNKRTIAAARASTAALLALVVPGCLLIACAGEQHKAPNVLLIVVDTLRADHLSFYGYPRETSPAIDALARDSVVFSDAMSQAPVTIPSVLQLMTGQLLMPKSIPPATETLAEVLRAAGYATMAVVDNPVIELRGTNLERGFDDFFINTVLDPDLRQQHWKTKTPADVITRRAIRWLAERKTDQPFFVWLHYFDPHDPYFPPYTQDLPFVRDSPSDWTGDLRRTPIYGRRSRGGDNSGSAADRQHLVDLYDAEIYYLNQSLNDLFDYLKRVGHYDDTLIVLTSDHGEAFGEHGHWAHGRSLHQNETHVPLIIKLPGSDAHHRVVDTPVQLIDIVPTVCAYLDLDCAARVSGRDILNESYENAYALWKFWVVVREGRWKLMYHSLTRQALLFDLSADPGEAVDLSDREPEVLARLLALKDDWLGTLKQSYRAAVDESLEQVEQLEALGYLE